MTMKYISTLFIAFLFIFSGLSSCDSNDKVYRIGVSQCNNDKWRQQMNYEMKREATFYEKRMAFDFRSANDDCDMQIRQIDSLIHSGIDILVVSPSDAAKLTPVIEKVWDKGIPVILAHQKIFSDKYTAFIGADNVELGHNAAAFIAATIADKGTVVEMMGDYNNSTTKDRHTGFMRKIKEFPQIQVAASVNCSLHGDDVKQVMDSLYACGVKPDAIFAHFNYTGIKAYEASKSHHEDVKIIGIDGSMGCTGGLHNVENGKLLASFVYPSGSAEIIHTIIRIIEDEPYDWETILHTAIITRDNKQTFRIQADQLEEREERLEVLDMKFDHLLSRSSMQRMLLISSCIIILLIGLAMVMGLRSYYLIMRRNEKLAEQKDKLEEQRNLLVHLSKELKDITRSKLKFFTQVSHEFRTPLALILAPTEELERSPNLQTEERKMLDIIHSNADILLRLINQSLDFRKMEIGKLRLNLQYINLPENFNNWCEPFKAVAQKRIIRYNFQYEPLHPDETPAKGWLDPNKVESILYNLISNALKFTPEGGKVNIQAVEKMDKPQHHLLVITVEDNGKGIAEDKIGKIFDLFYQGEAGFSGSGIGLTTSKAYAELHGGNLKVESKVGHGTRFILEMPYEADQDARPSDETLSHLQQGDQDTADEQNEGYSNISWPSKLEEPAQEDPDNDIPSALEDNEKYQEASKIISELAEVVHQSSDTISTHTENKPESSIVVNQAGHPADPRVILPDNDMLTDDGSRYTVLVIEDNKDMRAYIRMVLQEEYKVEEAEDGKQGLIKALQIIPDLVVCDLSDTEMDASECCKRMKMEWQTSHIPTIILTAGTQEEQYTRCLECGADSCLNKPFNRDIFLLLIRNLIANKQRIKAFYCDKTTLPTEDVNDLDKGFAERFLQVIETSLNDPDLSVETIATSMGIGRSQLYRKVKSLTGFTPIEMIRIARLKKAAEILKRTDHSVSEVAYEVGFSSPGYFTKCFSDYFGTSPSNYMKE